ncbi:hypothetical protein F4V57_14240 [Acinetobacter qingfengensis]|uniref:Uncharacterized protein n=1 Tax=Acinetobacter qingfengensis TaxID=1262585 RepID=A0A1E7QYR5_9GAMM|nr:hypothetical protein F4V57_14240 [Acinetobacter qingfengensis]OEY92212.1 hypothetical protein BJI46_05525 [Acinetobacter qingfengensis]
MIEWISNRVTRIEYAFMEFPKLKWLSLFYFMIFCLSIVLYQPLLLALYNLNFLGQYVLQDLISKNVHWLIWGQLVVPIIIAFFSYTDVSEKHDEMHMKKYGNYPKWI